MFSAADISDCELYRWTLTRRWREDRPVAVFCGCNPSTADARKNDPTILREIGFAERWGYGGLIKVNAYPFRTSKPRELARWCADDHDAYCDAMETNERHIIREAMATQLFVACWGGIAPSDWPSLLLSALREIRITVHHLGLTKDGHPKHPMARGKHRIPDNQKPIVWEPRS
jgi:hypothetical protein